MPPLFRQISMLLNDAAAVSSLSVVYAIVVGPRRKERWRIELPLLLLLLAAVLVLSFYISTTCSPLNNFITVCDKIVSSFIKIAVLAPSPPPHIASLLPHTSFKSLRVVKKNFNRTYSQNSRGLFQGVVYFFTKGVVLERIQLFEKNGEGTRAVA